MKPFIVSSEFLSVSYTHLVDGVRQLSDMAKSSGTYLDPALVKRIEVVRGPNSSLYGSGGLGGVVDFRTADAADFLPPGETNGLSLWGNIASGDHSTGSVSYTHLLSGQPVYGP